MQQAYTASTPYVVFGGNAGGRPGGFGGMFGGGQTNLVTAGSAIQITDASGNVLYSATAVRNASYVLFASPDLTSGASYTLKNGSTAVSTATAGAASSGNPVSPQDPGDPGDAPSNPDEPQATNIFQTVWGWIRTIFRWLYNLIFNRG